MKNHLGITDWYHFFNMKGVPGAVVELSTCGLAAWVRTSLLALQG